MSWYLEILKLNCRTTPPKTENNFFNAILNIFFHLLIYFCCHILLDLSAAALFVDKMFLWSHDLSSVSFMGKNDIIIMANVDLIFDIHDASQLIYYYNNFLFWNIESYICNMKWKFLTYNKSIFNATSLRFLLAIRWFFCHIVWGLESLRQPSWPIAFGHVVHVSTHMGKGFLYTLWLFWKFVVYEHHLVL